MKILIFSFFLFSYHFVFSQGNLQFNQLLTFQGQVTVGGVPNACGGCSVSSPIWTVPPGKIWKVESISSPTATITNPYVNSACGEGILFQNGFSLEGTTGNIYAKSGDNLRFTYNNSGCNGYGDYVYSISIIEFNIVP
jgi:hypothetical protein